MLNQPEVPKKEPASPKKDLAQQAVALFNNFFESHANTIAALS